LSLSESDKDLQRSCSTRREYVCVCQSISIVKTKNMNPAGRTWSNVRALASRPAKRYQTLVLFLALICFASSCSNIQLATKTDSSLSTDAIKLYDSTKSAFAAAGTKSYASRKSFYDQTYSTIDTLTLRAQVQESFNPKDKSVSNILTELAGLYHDIEAEDKRGTLLSDPTGLPTYLGELRDIYFELLRRANGGQPTATPQPSPSTSTAAAPSGNAESPSKSKSS
jgi:hypothetical protein